MDKKKVKELIQEVIRNNVDSLEFGDDKHNSPLRKANGLLHEVLIELAKSDWVSVEDGLPEYEEEVLVCNKTYPNRMVVTTRCKDVFYDNHNFVIQNMHVTHWKPIDKLED